MLSSSLDFTEAHQIVDEQVSDSGGSFNSTSLEAYSKSMNIVYRPELNKILSMAHFTCLAGSGHRFTHNICLSHICLRVLRDLPYL